MSIESTQEQKEIVKAVLDNEVLVVNAFPGTGKTSTLIMVSISYKTKKILYLCYGKDMQLEALNKFPNNTKVQTIHSLAYAGIIRYCKDIRIKELKDFRPRDVEALFGLESKVASVVLKLFKEFCKTTEDFIPIDFPFKEEKKLAMNMYELMIEGQIEPTFDFYIKYFEYCVRTGKIPLPNNYKIAMLDESQDTNPIYLSIFCMLNSPRKIYVGDEHQQIFSFNNSINAIKGITGKELALTESFRFHKEIARLATDLLKRFKNEHRVIRSNIEIDNKRVCNEVVYISRTNASIINKIKLLVDNDKKFKTTANPQKIFSLAVDIYNLIILNNKHVFENTFLYQYTDIEELATESEKVEDFEILNTIELCIEYGEEIETLYNIAKEYFRDDNYENEEKRIYLSNAHNSKGKEWERVVLDNDFPEAPFLIAKAGFSSLDDFIENLMYVNPIIIDEFNLLYVAITRAMYDLDYSNCDAVSYIRVDVEYLNYRTNKIYQALQKQGVV